MIREQEIHLENSKHSIYEWKLNRKLEDKVENISLKVKQEKKKGDKISERKSKILMRYPSLDPVFE